MPIAYSISGSGDVAILFLHGGLADRSFWAGQHAAFCEHYTVVAPDLAGHGESGAREQWGIPQCAQDVVAVIERENLDGVIVVGNSLGGAVAIEAAAMIGRRAIGVVGVDTFHDLNPHMDPAQAQELAETWRRDFSGSLDRMLRTLLHADAAPAFLADIRDRMAKASVDTVCAMFRSFGGYDMRPACRLLKVPVRCINGDLFPTNVQAGREIVPDFDAVILPHTGHYPMLESPDVFNRSLAEVAAAMTGSHTEGRR